MSFLSTRVATFSFLLGFPLVHAFACSAPNRDYGEDTASGGVPGGGKGSGGTSTTAGKNQGGAVGASGSSAEGGAIGEAGAGGVPTTGGSDSGGVTSVAGKSNAGGVVGNAGTSTGAGGVVVGSGGGLGTSGGVVGAGGGVVVGSGGGIGTCLSSGAEVCNDGKDNDCNGNVDCLAVTSSFPEPNGAAAGKDVLVIVNPPGVTGYTFQCRSARGGVVPETTAWAACPTGASTRIAPRTLVESQDPSLNGLWTTQIRAVYPGGGASDFIALTYYMHHTLHNAPRCTQRATDQAFFTAGAAVVADAGAFGTTTVTRSPFIQLAFTPTPSTYFNVLSGQGMTKIMSLRHRFFRRGDDHYMLMTRNYASSRSGVCDAMDLRTHDTAPIPINHNRFYYDDCEAIVFNKAGAGVCLYVDQQGAVQKRTSHVSSYLRITGFSPAADNFFWRKLLDKKSQSDGYLHFMPKCTSPGCERTGNNIFLPDRDKFPYF